MNTETRTYDYDTRPFDPATAASSPRHRSLRRSASRSSRSDKSGTLRAEAKVIHTGSSIVTAEGCVVGADGTLYAHGTTICLVLTPR